jgi:sulfoxide reductase heme-binding subunit YedZ
MEFIQSLSSWFSVWDTTRALALTSYLLLFVSVVAGVLQSMKMLPAKSKASIIMSHPLTGWLGLLFGLTHGLVLLYDNYVGYTLVEILVPFTAKQDPFEIGLGVIALYIVFLLVLSSDLLQRLGKQIWHKVHILAFPAFLMALYHGVAIGTDTVLPAIRFMYIFTGLVVLALIVMRIGYSLKSKKKQLLT